LDYLRSHRSHAQIPEFGCELVKIHQEKKGVPHILELGIFPL